MPVDHYENFPVASIVLPKHLRQPVEAIYRFARAADDIADEGQAPAEDRLAALGAFHDALHLIAKGQTLAVADLPASLSRIFVPLAATISQQQLPLVPFFDLLSAFEQDIQTKRYEDFAALQRYCERSANPVGRLMLYLYRHTDKASLAQSDAICTALQLVNFVQDVAIDWQKDRIYLPNDEMQRFGVTSDTIDQQRCDLSFKNLMAFQIDRCRSLLKSGEPLGRSLSGRIGLELRLIMHGGWRILDLIEKKQYDIFRHRPTLAKSDWAILLWRGLLRKPL